MNQPLNQTSDVHILESQPLPSPDEIKSQLPATETAVQTVLAARQAIKRMIRNLDSRLLVIVGPCSIHDEQAAMDYAERLKSLQEKVKSTLLLVMRVYFEKPRTVIGWKGMLNDPNLDSTSDIAHGLYKSRKIMLDIVSKGVPAASELLDPVTPQYISDLLAWGAVGARTTESQIHREMASGLSMPVGFKNNTDGNLQIAVDAIQSSRCPHKFVGINTDGKMYIWQSSGNVWSHIILRGGRDKPNYATDSMEITRQLLQKNTLEPFIMVDCSHANSCKDYRNQPKVWSDLIGQRAAGNEAIRGLMLESHIHEGKQDIPEDLSQLQYGVSITDACIDWDTTQTLLLNAHETLQTVS
ncbi:3-deoxy-7-phosphoheptulonate synthase [bacterium]|nr:3-deoxy-7-phosphoheptulonate synthase [bacterium]